MILGIIGSSAFLGTPLFSTFEKKIVNTEYGQVVTFVGKIGDMETVYISRHECGIEEKYTIPSEINYKALIAAYKECNCDYVLGTYSTGSLKLSIPVSSLVIPDDYATLQPPLYFHSDSRCHFSPKINEELRKLVADALNMNEISFINTGSYFQTTGPRFETKAEIRFYAHFFDLVGMTGSSEATLAQELGLKYCMLCMVDNMCNGIGEELTYEKLSAANKSKFIDALTKVCQYLSIH